MQFVKCVGVALLAFSPALPALAQAQNFPDRKSVV